MFTNSKLAKSVKLACAFGVASAATIASNAVVAQEEAAEELVEKISVTGSRIRRADIESASPVTVINREELELTGLTDVGDFIQSLPSMSGSPIGTTTNNGGNGSVQINLRGLGAVRTLTLVNGRRTVDGGDYQSIPATMIERIEVLKDGSSAVYGADAVAGVVNIITRKDFEGVDVTYQTADWFDTDGGGQDSLSLIFGSTFDSGNFVFGLERVDQDDVFQADTPWDFMQNSYYIYPAGCEAQVTAPYDGTASGGCYPIGSSRIPESRLPFYSQGTFLIGTPASAENQAGLMIPHDGRTYNYAPVNYLQTPFERTNVFAEANYEISDSVQFSAEFRGNQRTSAQQLAPLPFTGGDPMYDGFYDDPATGNTVAFTGVSQDNYYLRQAVDNYNAANGASLVYEPVVNPRRRMIETNRRFEQDITQYQWNADLNGELDNDLGDDNRMLANDSMLADNDELNSKKSSVAADFFYRLNHQWQISADIQYNTIEDFTDKGQVNLDYMINRYNLIQLNHRYTRNVSGDRLEQMSLLSSVAIDNNWAFVGRLTRDFQQDRNLESYLGVQYESCCWAIRVAAYREINPNLSTNNSTQNISDEFDSGINIKLIIKGLDGKQSAIGTQEMFKNSIFGYKQPFYLHN
jgi:outer membrane receptor protein involved in Fe transport